MSRAVEVLLEPSPCLFERLRICPYHTVKSATLPDSGKTFLSEADYLVDPFVCFGVAKREKLDEGNS